MAQRAWLVANRRQAWAWIQGPGPGSGPGPCGHELWTWTLNSGPSSMHQAPNIFDSQNHAVRLRGCFWRSLIQLLSNASWKQLNSDSANQLLQAWALGLDGDGAPKNNKL